MTIQNPQTRRDHSQAIGLRALCVLSAETGRKQPKGEQFAAVIFDLLIPGIDRFEFLERFRQTPVGVFTPVDYTDQQRDHC